MSLALDSDFCNSHYSAETGRFLSEDPIGFVGRDFSLYRYVENNPIRYKDPTGLVFERPEDDDPIGRLKEGIEELEDTYDEFIDRGLKNGDKYFHCLANCRASKAGAEGKTIADILSTGREVGQFLKGDSAASCSADLRANKVGRDAGDSRQSCTQSCLGFKENRLISTNPLD